ncbi:MAG: UDP-N-acetylenolpyruvoylglucosamine reductase, partial [Clostridia bacterium]
LIDDCKLKGTKVGGAQVSTLHAGFIVNSGNATSKDIIELAKLVKEKVEKEFGKVLIPEVQIIGEE